MDTNKPVWLVTCVDKTTGKLLTVICWANDADEALNFVITNFFDTEMGYLLTIRPQRDEWTSNEGNKWTFDDNPGVVFESGNMKVLRVQCFKHDGQALLREQKRIQEKGL